MSALCTTSERATDDVGPIITSGSPSPNVVTFLGSLARLLNRSRSNALQQKGSPDESEQHEQPDKESPTSREVVMDMTEQEHRGLRRDTEEPRMVALCYEGVPPKAFRGIASIPLFTGTTIDEHAEFDFH